MEIFRRIYESDAAMALILIFVPNTLAALVGWRLLRRAKTWSAFSKRVGYVFILFILISNVLAVALLSSLNPDHGFYWFDENEGATWIFSLLPTSILCGLIVASVYLQKLVR